MKKLLFYIKPYLTGRQFVISVPFIWLLLLTLVPILIVLRISLSEMDVATVADLWVWAENTITLKINLSKYLFILHDDLYVETFTSSIGYALENTLLCLMLGYPFAYFMARSKPHLRPMLLMLVMLPFWTSFLLRIYAWKTLLENNGVINNFLMWTGLINTPIQMMHTQFSLMVGMVYTYLPFMILPLYSNLVKMDVRYLEASADLGASPWKTFWLMTVPLSTQGIIAGSMLVFIPTVGEYVIPELLGGPQTLNIGRVLWDEFFTNNDWSMASAVAVVLVLVILIPMAIFNYYQSKSYEGATS